MATERADIGLVGLGVMGMNLILNISDHGFTVCAFNRTTSKVDNFLQNEAKGKSIIGAHTLEELVNHLKTPRIIFLLVQTGKPVDDLIANLVPLLKPNDILIDGGNADFLDSKRRCLELSKKQLHFVGCGVSGGEEGARHGPSLMPGGQAKAWMAIKLIFQKVAAKAPSGEPCADWIGDGGSGHLVKTIHNGIEYGDMQLIAEAYHIMKTIFKMTNTHISETFATWNKGVLESFLIEITSNIMKFKDSTGHELVDKIRDAAGQKGTGKWTAIHALKNGIPVTIIAESVFARCLSALKEERTHASSLLSGPTTKNPLDITIKDVEEALYASKIMSYAQGFMLMRSVANEHGWKLNFGTIALTWRSGCIIRSRFLQNIKEAFDRDPNLNNIALDSFFRKALAECQTGWRKVVACATMTGIPIPTFSAALAFYDGYRSEFLPANLIQAQRDYFGAHQYELLSNPGHFQHTDWAGTGGKTTAGVYQV